MERAWYQANSPAQVDVHGVSWVAEPAPEPSDSVIDEPPIVAKDKSSPGSDAPEKTWTPRTGTPSSHSRHASRSPSSFRPSSGASSCTGSPLSRQASCGSLLRQRSSSPTSLVKQPQRSGTPLMRQPSPRNLLRQACASPVRLVRRPPRQPCSTRADPCKAVGFTPSEGAQNRHPEIIADPLHSPVLNRPPRPHSNAKMEPVSLAEKKRIELAVERRISAPAAPVLSPERVFSTAAARSPSQDWAWQHRIQHTPGLVQEAVISTAAKPERSPSQEFVWRQQIQNLHGAGAQFATARRASSVQAHERRASVLRQSPTTSPLPRSSECNRHIFRSNVRPSSCPGRTVLPRTSSERPPPSPVVRSYTPVSRGAAHARFEGVRASAPKLAGSPPAPYVGGGFAMKQQSSRQFATTSTQPSRASSRESSARPSRVGSPACREKQASTPRLISVASRAETPRTRMREINATPNDGQACQHNQWSPFSLKWLHDILLPQKNPPQQSAGQTLKNSRPPPGGLTDISHSDIQYLEQIGTGSFGAVWRATFQGQEVAVKSCKVGDSKDTNMLLKEIQCLQSLRHPCLVSFLGCCNKAPHVLMLMEYMPGGSLYNLLFKTKLSLDFDQKSRMACEVAEGLTYIHSLNVVHRDLKSANIVLDNALRCKICDFGLTVALEHTHLTVLSLQGSPRYMAPEQFEPAAKITDKVDVWQFGCVMLELFCGLTPFKHFCSLQQVARELLVHRRPPSIPADADPWARALVQACFRIPPATRPVAVVLERALYGIRKGHIETKISSRVVN